MKALAVTLISITTILYVNSVDIEYVIQNHPLYLSADAQVEAARIGLDKEYVFYYPFDGNLEIENSSLVSDTKLNLAIGFSLSYTIFNPDMTKRLESKKVLIETSKEYRESIYQLLKYKINKLALNYHSSKKIYEQSVVNYKSIENYTEKLQERFNSRDLSKSEIAYAESILFKNKAILIDSKEVVEKSLRFLNMELGTDSEDPQLYPEFDSIKQIDINRVILEDPKIKQVTLVILNAKENILLTKTNTIPDVTLTTSVTYPLDSDLYWKAGVDVSIPMFGIKYDNHTKAEYKEELRTKENQLELLIREKKNRLENIINRIESVTEKLILYRSSLKLSQTSLEGILIEANAGVRTVFDVIDATNNLSEIKKYIVESENELELLKLDYTYQIGGYKSNGN